MSTVYIVTSTELGWDCIIGVFDSESVSKESLEKTFDPDLGYIVHYPRTVEKDLIDYEEEGNE